MRPPSFLAAMSVLAALLLPASVRAGAGHDHGDAPAAPGAALPRFAAVSESFELVGVLQGRQLTLYLDRTADNAPVTGAQIELEIAGARLQAEPHDDAYEIVLAAEPQPGVLPVTATVTVGQEIDLLAGELDLHEAVQAGESAPLHDRRLYAGWAACAVAALVLLAVLRRRAAAARQRRAGAVA